MSELLELETLHVSGTPRELGRGQGEAFRAKIHRFVQMRFDALQGYFTDRGRPDDWKQVMRVGEESFALYAKWDAAGHEELLGIAEGADIEPVKLFTITNMTDMRDAVLLSAPSGPPLKGPSEGGLSPADAEGCSSMLVPASHTSIGKPLVGQTWDLNPPDVEYVVAIRRDPAEGPRTWAITCTGCLSLVGINDAGLAVGTTNIKTYGSGPGVGYLSILHRAIRCTSAGEARDLVKEAPHAGAHTYWLADATQQLEWEASPNGQHLRTTQDGPVWRTNHCLFEDHQRLQGEVPGDSSKARFERLGEMLEAKRDVEGLKEIFRDRSRGVLSINRYAEDEQGTATNAVIVASPADKTMWACRGPADRGAWRELGFD